MKISDTQTKPNEIKMSNLEIENPTPSTTFLHGFTSMTVTILDNKYTKSKLSKNGEGQRMQNDFYRNHLPNGGARCQPKRKLLPLRLNQ